MNLFRSEEHVKNWSQYDSLSEEAIMPLTVWAKVFSGPLFRERLEPDYLSKNEKNMIEFLNSFQELGKAGSFWTPQ